MSKQQCRWCQHQYEAGGLWDDGFCCGAHRASARKNNISGKTPRGCIYLFILICFAFFGLFLYINNYCCPVKVFLMIKIRLKPSCRISASFVTLLVGKKILVT